MRPNKYGETISHGRTTRKTQGAASLPGDGQTIGALEKLVADGRTFGTIYADPPWLYDNQAEFVRWRLENLLPQTPGNNGNKVTIHL